MVVEAGVVAAMTISTSSSYSLAETVSARHSLNLDFTHGRLFYGVAIVSTLVAAGIVLIPGAPLLAMTLTVNVIATLLMAPALHLHEDAACSILGCARDPLGPPGCFCYADQ